MYKIASILEKDVHYGSIITIHIKHSFITEAKFTGIHALSTFTYTLSEYFHYHRMS